MDPRAVQCLRISKGGVDGGMKLRFSPGQTRQPTLPRRPISRWCVEQYLNQTNFLQPRCQMLRGVVVGKQILNPSKAVFGCGGKALGKVIFSI